MGGTENRIIWLFEDLDIFYCKALSLYKKAVLTGLADNAASLTHTFNITWVNSYIFGAPTPVEHFLIFYKTSSQSLKLKAY